MSSAIKLGREIVCHITAIKPLQKCVQTMCSLVNWLMCFAVVALLTAVVSCHHTKLSGCWLLLHFLHTDMNVAKDKYTESGSIINDHWMYLKLGVDTN